MGDAIAVDGEVTATPGTSMYSGATGGSWTAGAVTYTSHSKIRSGGKEVIYKAECTFTFSGTSGNSPVSGTEKVTLQASKKKLSCSGNYVLVNGDSKQGTYGNKLEAKASNTKFKTS